jgi:glycosyltransferase involved in cell wall biosynthesis
MRIAVAGPFAFWPKATVSRRAFPLARALARAGHEVAVFVPPFDNPSQSGKVFWSDGVLVVNVRTGPDSLLTRLVTPIRLALAVARWRPDVVHTFKAAGYAATAGLYLRLFGRYPWVLDTDDLEGSAGWAGINGYSLLTTRLIDLQEHRLPRLAGAVTAASRFLAAELVRWGVRAGRVFYLPNGVDPDLAHRPLPDPTALRRKLGPGPVLIFVGYLTRGSDLDLALRALARLRPTGLRPTLLVVGDGAALPALKTLAGSLGLGEQVRWAGRVPPEELGTYLAAADVALYPCRDVPVNRAKCAMKLVEYMAAGRAIIAGRVGQNPEYIVDGESGRLVDCENPDEFAGAMADLLADPNLRARLGAEARRRVFAEFSWGRLAVEAEEAYRAAVECGRG